VGGLAGDAPAGAPGARDAPAADAAALLRALVHDLRTPLAVVLGFAELLARDPEGLTPAQRADYVRRVAEGAEQLRALLDEAAQAARSVRSSGGAGK
jgi:K+-sensing histidine kinase KdpD